MTAQRIAFIGLGAMGLPMASNIARAGLDVVGFDVRPEPLSSLAEAGGKAAHSAQEAASNADVAIVIPLNARQVQDALFGPDGVLDGLPRGSTVIVMATIGAQASPSIGFFITSAGSLEMMPTSRSASRGR